MDPSSTVTVLDPAVPRVARWGVTPANGRRTAGSVTSAPLRLRVETVTVSETRECALPRSSRRRLEWRQMVAAVAGIASDVTLPFRHNRRCRENDVDAVLRK